MTTPFHRDPLLAPERLAEIAELDLIREERDEVLAEIATRAAELLDLPIAMVSVVLDGAQMVAAHHGPLGWVAEVGGHPAEWSFCANTVRTGEPFVVEDATNHPVTRDNPLVRLEGAGCYAGIPLVTSRGQTVGSLCVVGTAPRAFGEDELEQLAALAARVVERMESRRSL